MAAGVGPGDGVREILMVLAVALAGLLLAGLVAFTPWYAAGVLSVVEMHGPAGGVGAGGPAR